jgi:hypothetical protein
MAFFRPKQSTAERNGCAVALFAAPIVSDCQTVDILRAFLKSQGKVGRSG